jgi:septal ring factor EnvC (AmiA/AmiB activator)
MKKKKALFLLTILTHVSFFLSQSVFTQQDVSEYEKRLEKIRSQISELKSKISEEEKKESSILTQLEKIGYTKKLIRNELAYYSVELEKTSQELASLKKNVLDLESKLEKEKQSIQKILVTLYKFGKFSFLQFMLQAENVGALVTENKHLTLLAQYQESIISDYLKTLAELKAAEDKLGGKKAEINQIIQSANQKKQELEAEEKKNNALIQQIEQNKKAYEQTLQELKDSAEQLQLLIEKLQKQEMPFPFPLVPLYEKKGKLPWPLDGKVITKFGLQKHSRFNTITMNNGIEIAPQKNNLMAKAVQAGKVVYAEYFQGYGNLIILDHGMTYYSLYGHCSEFLVKKGEIVKAEQPIAVIGDLGSIKGVSLYFEIRFKTKPLDPLQWLKRR